MATGKRYYWIKLKDSFMNSEVVDFLMSQPDGANYVVLYQMLCLKTINTAGRLTCQIGDIIIPFDVGKIQRDCKYFKLDTIRIALNLYKQLGLIYEEQDGTLVLANHADMVGSETDYAEKNRRMRSNAAAREIQAGHDSGHQSGHNVSSCGGENVTIDIRDKRTEIRDKDIRDRDNGSGGSSAVDAGLAQIIGSFEENLGGFPPAAREALLQWRTVFSDDMILLAIKKAAMANVRKWSYVNGILKSWKAEGVCTLADAQENDNRRSSPGGQQARKTAVEDYDEIFGGLV